jgi:uncharacterized protein YndB with AHSA1/START domain
MSTTTTGNREAQIEADPQLPTVRITREFDASPEKVFRAWTDPDLVARWLGPQEHHHPDHALGCANRWQLSVCGGARR